MSKSLPSRWRNGLLAVAGVKKVATWKAVLYGWGRMYDAIVSEGVGGGLAGLLDGLGEKDGYD